MNDKWQATRREEAELDFWRWVGKRAKARRRGAYRAERRRRRWRDAIRRLRRWLIGLPVVRDA